MSKYYEQKYRKYMNKYRKLIIQLGGNIWSFVIKLDEELLKKIPIYKNNLKYDSHIKIIPNKNVTKNVTINNVEYEFIKILGRGGMVMFIYIKAWTRNIILQ